MTGAEGFTGADVQRRLETQREYLAIQGLIAHLPRVQDRLLATLSHLAERFGYVSSRGTVLPLPFSHAMLGMLSAAQRSTVTIALGALASQDVAHRLEDGSWLLTPAADRWIQAVLQPEYSPPALGEQLMLRRTTNQSRTESRALRAEAGQIRSQRRAASRDA